MSLAKRIERLEAEAGGGDDPPDIVHVYADGEKLTFPWPEYQAWRADNPPAGDVIRIREVIDDEQTPDAGQEAGKEGAASRG